MSLWEFQEVCGSGLGTCISMHEGNISLLNYSISEHITKYSQRLSDSPFHSSDSHWLHTSETQDNLWGIFGGQIGVVAYFFQLLASYRFTNAAFSHLSYEAGNSISIWGFSIKEFSLVPIPRTEKLCYHSIFFQALSIIIITIL